MRFKDIIESPSGIGHIFRRLELHTSVGRKVLMNSMMFTAAADIEYEQRRVQEFYNILSKGEGSGVGVKMHSGKDDVASQNGLLVEIEHLKGLLCSVRDVYGSIERIADASSVDDIELFEIKDLSFTTGQVAQALGNMGIASFQLPDMTGIISILDPEGLKLRSFFIYDAYSKELAKLRVEIRRGEEANGSEKHLELIAQADELENKIRFALSARLKNLAPRMKKVLDMLGHIDLVLAKAELMKRYNLVMPSCSDNGTTCLNGLFHPQVMESLEAKGEKFTPVDIEYGKGVSLITGANMGGKSVLLKMIALCQQLFQFGFPVPAANASIAVKNAIFFSIGDEQDVTKGLSSFASEMLSINRVIEHLEGEKEQIERGMGEGLALMASGNGTLALIDEPARTTNPIEGKALVESLVNLLEGFNVDAVLTTHYNVNCNAKARWRVRGLSEGRMDYRLVSTTSSDIPHEAVMVARSLNINGKWIDAAERILESRSGAER